MNILQAKYRCITHVSMCTLNRMFKIINLEVSEDVALLPTIVCRGCGRKCDTVIVRNGSEIDRRF